MGELTTNTSLKFSLSVAPVTSQVLSHLVGLVVPYCPVQTHTMTIGESSVGENSLDCVGSDPRPSTHLLYDFVLFI
jgi:hypothetical protein